MAGTATLTSATPSGQSLRRSSSRRIASSRSYRALSIEFIPCPSLRTSARIRTSAQEKAEMMRRTRDFVKRRSSKRCNRLTRDVTDLLGLSKSPSARIILAQKGPALLDTSNPFAARTTSAKTDAILQESIDMLQFGRNQLPLSSLCERYTRINQSLLLQSRKNPQSLVCPVPARFRKALRSQASMLRPQLSHRILLYAITPRHNRSLPEVKRIIAYLLRFVIRSRY